MASLPHSPGGSPLDRTTPSVYTNASLPYSSSPLPAEPLPPVSSPGRPTAVIDHFTGMEYENVDNRIVEMLYREDPGYFIHSLAGCVYHWVRNKLVDGKRLYECAPADMSFKLPLPSLDLGQANYSRIYFRWMVTSCPPKILSVWFPNGLDNNIRPKAARAIYMARQAHILHSLDRAKQALDYWIRQDIHQIDPKWYEDLRRDDLNEKFISLWPLIHNPVALINKGRQTSAGDPNITNPANWANLNPDVVRQEMNKNGFHAFHGYVQKANPYISDINLLHPVGPIPHHEHLIPPQYPVNAAPPNPGNVAWVAQQQQMWERQVLAQPHTTPANFNAYQDAQSHFAYLAGDGNLPNVLQTINQAPAMDPQVGRESLIVKLKIPKHQKRDREDDRVQNPLTKRVRWADDLQDISTISGTDLFGVRDQADANPGFLDINDEDEDRHDVSEDYEWLRNGWNDENQEVLLRDAHTNTTLELHHQLGVLDGGSEVVEQVSDHHETDALQDPVTEDEIWGLWLSKEATENNGDWIIRRGSERERESVDLDKALKKQ